MMIDSRDQLERAAVEYGLLPFFANRVSGLSVQELAAPGMLFGDDDDGYGCWDWKGPVIRERTTAYGKFFNRKAGFVSLDLLPDFLNYRRHAYPVKPDSTDEMILDIIRENEGLSSTELRRYIFGDTSRRRGPADLVDTMTPSDFIGSKPGRHSLEGPLQRLQMGGHLLICDFQYKHTRTGARYGWGVALYSTPEVWFESDFPAPDNRTASQSFTRLVDHVARNFPHVAPEKIKALLK